MTTESINGAFIERRHPQFYRMSKKWEFWLDSYMLTVDEYAPKYMHQNEREGKEEFATRCEKAIRENHSKRCVDLINTYLFKQPAVRKTDNKHLKDFIENADGKGKTLNLFMKEVSQFASVMGRVYVVIDRLDPKDMTGTYKDDLESKPYCYLMFPQDVLDIAFHVDGTVRWAIVREWVRDDEDPFAPSGEMYERFRLWTAGKTYLYDTKTGETTSKTTGLDIVPIVAVDNEEAASDYYGQSLISTVAYLDKAIFNNYSRLDVIVEDQTFSQLIFPIEGALVSNLATDQKAQEEFLTLATNRVLFYSAASEARPEYISPDADQAEFILSLIQHYVKQLYATMGLQNEGRSESTDYQSGNAKGYDFDKLNKLLADKADNLEIAEKKLCIVAMKWKGLKDIEVEVDYPDDFDVKTLSQEILLAQELTLLNVSEKFTKEIHKRVAEKALPKLPKEQMDAIKKEIDEKVMDPEIALGSSMDFSSQNNGDDNFAEKQTKGKMGGRLKQKQSKAEQM